MTQTKSLTTQEIFERPTTHSVRPPTDQITSSITEKELTTVKVALVDCMGPIAHVLVKRHASKATNVHALIKALEVEVGDEKTRSTFRSAMAQSKLL